VRQVPFQTAPVALRKDDVSVHRILTVHMGHTTCKHRIGESSVRSFRPGLAGIRLTVAARGGELSPRHPVAQSPCHPVTLSPCHPGGTAPMPDELQIPRSGRDDKRVSRDITQCRLMVRAASTIGNRLWVAQRYQRFRSGSAGYRPAVPMNGVHFRDEKSHYRTSAKGKLDPGTRLKCFRGNALCGTPNLGTDLPCSHQNGQGTQCRSDRPALVSIGPRSQTMIAP
jgi:hypothetical protein